MALQYFKEFDDGSTADEAYVIVETMRLDHIHGVSFVTVIAKIYLDISSFQNGDSPRAVERHCVCQFLNWTKRRARNNLTWHTGIFEDDEPDPRFQFFVNQPIPIQGGYAFLKSLPQFDGAIDV